MTVGEADVQYEGEMLRKIEEDNGELDLRLKAYNYRIVGKELYNYRKEDSE